MKVPIFDTTITPLYYTANAVAFRPLTTVRGFEWIGSSYVTTSVELVQS